MCIQVVKANVGGRYGRPSIQAKRDDGYEPISAVRDPYGDQYMARACADCQCASPETCLTLQDLGVYCESHGVAG